MVQFVFGIVVGGAVMFMILLVYGLCTVSKRADQEAELAERLRREFDKPDPEPKRNPIAVFVRGDETILN